MTTAIVVGAGPNGLASAVTLARAGVDVTVLEASSTIGGGTRSSELTLPGLLHDECSAFHPFASASPVLDNSDPDTAVHWGLPPVQYAHPLNGGGGAAAYRSLEMTAQNLGRDGAAWTRVFGPVVDKFDDLGDAILGPVLRIPRHPITLGRFGLRAGLPATVLARAFRTPEGRALWGGVAAHAMRPLGGLMTSSIGAALAAAAHAYGWPVAIGGSQAIADNLAAELLLRGGTIKTDYLVASLDELPVADIVMLDVAPGAAASIVGDRMPGHVRRAYRRYRHGPGAFKVDFAVQGAVPWQFEPAQRSGTVHVGGTFEQIAHAEREVARGRMPGEPFVLVGQQAVADPSRAAGDVQPLYTYAHVPHGYSGDATEAIVKQIERFAPGFRDRILATAVRTTTDLARHNPNYVGGDIVTGANMARQLVFRPRVSMRPYDTGVPGVYLCSAATPPGAGAHGACGFHAANRALTCR